MIKDIHLAARDKLKLNCNNAVRDAYLFTMYVPINKIAAHMYWFLLRCMYIDTEFVLVALETISILLDFEKARNMKLHLYFPI